VCVCVKDN